MIIPNTTLQTRVRDETIKGENPFHWKEVNTDDLFKGQRVLIFGLPGAFTPTCSNYQLPNFDYYYHDFIELGINEIYCISVNDAFVMYQWAKSLDIRNVKLLPDGNGEFTRKLGMLVKKENLGFGYRSWRYAMVVNDGVIEAKFVEEGLRDNCADDPYKHSTPETIRDYLENYQDEVGWAQKQ